LIDNIVSTTRTNIKIISIFTSHPKMAYFFWLNQMGSRD